jgi:CubicO group peptidase (beta-lactamase class C family)
MLFRILPSAAALVMVAAQLALCQQSPSTVLDQSFDARIDSVMKAWKVPGIGIGVVKGNRIVLLKGYGFKDLATKAPVTKDTKFAIGSATKSFTVTALEAQAAEGKLDWDAPVRRYLSDFQMFDPVVTERMTPRDLVTHRSGLPRHDVIWGGGTLSREQLFERLRYLEPTKDFRSVFQYQNLMFMAAGYLSGKIDDKQWEDVIRTRVFAPLGMNTADLSVSDLTRSPDYAFPYTALPNDSVVRIPYRHLDPIGPAGAIHASISEMVRYVSMHLNQGMFEGRAIISAAAAHEMQIPQMVMPIPSTAGPGGTELGHEQYGMGFMVGSYRGRKMVHHGGNIDGFSAEVNFLPNDSIGVVVLTNLNSTATRDFIPFMVYDRLLGLAPIDWSGRYKVQADRAVARQNSTRAAEAASRVPNTKPSRPLGDFAGSYNHPGYGDITITQTGDRLMFVYSSFSLELSHFHYDVFETAPRSVANPTRWKVQFLSDAAGKVNGLSVPFEPALKPLVFARKRN